MMTNQNETNSKRPTHNAYILKDSVGNDKPDWIKVGAVWEHADQKGFNLVLNLLGHDINLVIRQSKAK